MARSSRLEAEKKRIFRERGKQYGDYRLSSLNVGLAWTGILQSHYQRALGHPIPPHVVTQMLAAMKLVRAGFPRYHPDNYVDAHVYLDFSQEQHKGVEHDRR